VQKHPTARSFGEGTLNAGGSVFQYWWSWTIEVFPVENLFLRARFVRNSIIVLSYLSAVIWDSHVPAISPGLGHRSLGLVRKLSGWVRSYSVMGSGEFSKPTAG
jgi:hypothetical protein